MAQSSPNNMVSFSFSTLFSLFPSLYLIATYHSSIIAPKPLFATATTIAGPVISHETIHGKILNEQRFVVFNSRRLTGECLSICDDPSTTTNDGILTENQPSEAPMITVEDDSSTPTTNNLNTLRVQPDSNDDTNYSSDLIFEHEQEDEDGAAVEGCLCEVNDTQWDQSWKCGDDEIYVCPNVGDTICSTQAEEATMLRGRVTRMTFYQLSDEQCDAMRLIDVGQPCIDLPQYYDVKVTTTTRSKGLTDRVCYKNGGLGVNGMKQSDESCDACPSRTKINFERRQEF